MSIPNQIQEITPVSAALIQDPRWQVVERIVQSPSFQKSERLKAFLTYVVQQYLAGHPEKLTGHQIGIAVFGKTDSYDQAEDKPFARMRGNSGFGCWSTSTASGATSQLLSRYQRGRTCRCFGRCTLRQWRRVR